ncbi:hypothetical protein FXO37_22695 [Capsicum annuum]|nr:hypothetical protein FXO37_22695 [Capsicum annuum]
MSDLAFRIGPHNSQFLKSKEKSTWSAKDVADSVLSDKSALLRIDNSADKFLHYAAAIDRVDLMEILCLGYADIDLNSIDSQGRTALHIAAIHRHVKVLRFLLPIGTLLSASRE